MYTDVYKYQDVIVNIVYQWWWWWFL